VAHNANRESSLAVQRIHLHAALFSSSTPAGQPGRPLPYVRTSRPASEDGAGPCTTEAPRAASPFSPIIERRAPRTSTLGAQHDSPT
jgi:hypothetical protein